MFIGRNSFEKRGNPERKSVFGSNLVLFQNVVLHSYLDTLRVTAGHLGRETKHK